MILIIPEVEDIMIYKAGLNDVKIIAKMAHKMWSSHTLDELEEEFHEIIVSEDSAEFIVTNEGKAIGFAQCQLRYDYVEGTSSSPVGYLEGIFIEDGFRKKGYARELLKNCEQWSLEKGCTEFASDCELSNDTSLKFHLNVGFKEANRIICFTKNLKTGSTLALLK